ncbi:MAG: TlpA family protein disulfide reductase [Acidobacteriota bacterium]|nr:TlpA family protein disulfide reductase [Acidobacteriota bacterium]
MSTNPTAKAIMALAITALIPAPISANEIPRPAPGFTILMNGGAPIQLTGYKGKTVVVIFLLTTCPHCQKITGILSKLQNEHGPRGLQVLGCAIDDMASMYVPDFVKKFQPAFPIGFSPRDPVLAFLQHPVMLRLMMPQVVFIDREQMIRAQYSGDHAILEGDAEEKLRAAIEPLLIKPGQKNSAAPRKKVS